MNKTRRIYISLPIAGKPLELVKIKIQEIKRVISRTNTAVYPSDLINDKGDDTDCMGIAVKTLLSCDAVYFCRGWQHSKRCTAEYEIAKIYNKEIIFE